LLLALVDILQPSFQMKVHLLLKMKTEGFSFLMRGVNSSTPLLETTTK
jgi:hypothetical protein